MKKQTYCSNCGNIGHAYKNCNDPITSHGVILFRVPVEDVSIRDNMIENFFHNNLNVLLDTVTIDVEGIQYDNICDMERFLKYKENINFLMVRRKHTLGYVEFIRGRYDVDNSEGITFLFKQMTPNEIKTISEKDFDYLWDDLWSSRNKNSHQSEYIKSKEQFEILKFGNCELSLQFYTNVHPDWEYPEWGFPKGRRNYQESNLHCAIREFEEETGFTKDDYVVLDKLSPLEETFVGTNGINYKHIYYIAISVSNKVPEIDNNNYHQFNEIGDIGWFQFEEGIRLIRPHHLARKEILCQLFMYIVNHIFFLQ